MTSRRTGSRDPIREYLEWKRHEDRKLLAWKALAWAMLIGSALAALVAVYILLVFLFTLA